MKIHLKIKRFDPTKDKKPYWKEYDVEAEPTDRVLDALQAVQWEQDGTLSLRRSCAHGVCGSDAMRINGRNMLACKVLVKDVAQSGNITVEPILGLPVQKDLIVDMEPFFAHYRSVMPFLVNNDPLPENGRERLQSTTPPSASCARLAPPAARRSGRAANTWGRRPSFRRIASSSTRATRPRRSACRC
jgi:succinate dehydrogenase / fumarate reductase iron-sulfur subunit